MNDLTRVEHKGNSTYKTCNNAQLVFHESKPWFEGTVFGGENNRPLSLGPKLFTICDMLSTWA